jgi:hypothetical protein
VKQSCIAARAVFVLDDILFAIEPQPGPDDPHALEQIRAMTPPIVAAFHFAHHLGDEISCFEALRAATRLPLPTTHFDRDLVFQLDPAHAHRLRIRDEGGQTATILSAKGENELRFSGAPGATYEWELRRLYDDDIMSNPIGVGEATALTESQQTWRALTTSANDSIFSLGSLGCWNDVIAVVLQRPEPTDEQLVLLHAIFDQSLSWWDAKGIATLQDKTFRDAINAVFTLLEQRRTRP